jgi:micrococcal nuclease
VLGKVVDVEPVSRDRYNRTVAWVSEDWRSLNIELVRAGLVWWFRRYAGNNAELAGLEKEARAVKAGLWPMPNPVPDFSIATHRFS